MPWHVGFYSQLVNLPCTTTEMTTVLPTFCTEDKTLNVTSCVIQVVMCFSLPKFF